MVRQTAVKKRVQKNGRYLLIDTFEKLCRILTILRKMFTITFDWNTPRREGWIL
jgi:hypothetical protein